MDDSKNTHQASTRLYLAKKKKKESLTEFLAQRKVPYPLFTILTHDPSHSTGTSTKPTYSFFASAGAGPPVVGKPMKILK
jgi:hypothetical protein